MSRLFALAFLSILGTVACSSGESGSDPSTEDALEQGGSGSIDMKKYSLVQALITANEDTATKMKDAILSTSKKEDKSDRLSKGAAIAGMVIDDEGAGIICDKDGATRQMMCSLVMGVVRSSDVKGRESGAPGILLPTQAKLTGKLADAVAEALPKKSETSTGAGPVECKKVEGGHECTVPLTGFGMATTLETMIDQTKEEEGAAKAAETRVEFEKMIRELYPNG